ncbi:hypothetical protein B0H19DRAFT_1059405 [Mycena capillaripes]|nr:hypothetical protein B0H19DRAFT_1059405 [Mycena capillaripes]
MHRDDSEHAQETRNLSRQINQTAPPNAEIGESEVESWKEIYNLAQRRAGKKEKDSRASYHTPLKNEGTGDQRLNFFFVGVFQGIMTKFQRQRIVALIAAKFDRAGYLRRAKRGVGAGPQFNKGQVKVTGGWSLWKKRAVIFVRFSQFYG